MTGSHTPVHICLWKKSVSYATKFFKGRKFWGSANLSV